MTETKQDNRSASQKITDLENAVMSIYQTVDNLARDFTNFREAIKLLNNKVDSIVKASSTGEPINDGVINRIMIENNVEELSNKTKLMVSQGILVAQEVVGDDSFVVGSELNEDGTVANPRLQFALFALQQELRDKIKGSKVGDVLTLQEGKLKFKVIENYQIQQPKTQEPATAATPVTTETAPEVAQVTAATVDTSPETTPTVQ